MGFVSAIVINNDLIHSVKEDTEFGSKVYHAVMTLSSQNKNEWGIYSGSGMAAYAVACHHAAVGVPVIIGGGNFFTRLSPYLGQDTPAGLEMQLLKKLADKHGFDLHKKRQPR